MLAEYFVGVYWMLLFCAPADAPGSDAMLCNVIVAAVAAAAAADDDVAAAMMAGAMWAVGYKYFETC